MHRVKMEIPIPEHLGKKYIKKYEKQRKKRGFSDYDAFDTGDYIMDLIPMMIDRLCEFKHTYSPVMWMYETKEVRKDLTEKEYYDELKLVADKLRGCHPWDDWRYDAQELEATRQRCFEWLGHNIMSLWD